MTLSASQFPQPNPSLPLHSNVVSLLDASGKLRRRRESPEPSRIDILLQQGREAHKFALAAVIRQASPSSEEYIANGLASGMLTQETVDEARAIVVGQGRSKDNVVPIFDRPTMRIYALEQIGRNCALIAERARPRHVDKATG